MVGGATIITHGLHKSHEKEDKYWQRHLQGVGPY